jgi:hypothetical protein
MMHLYRHLLCIDLIMFRDIAALKSRLNNMSIEKILYVVCLSMILI